MSDKLQKVILHVHRTIDRLTQYEHWRIYWYLTRKVGICVCCDKETTVGRLGDCKDFHCYACAFCHPGALDYCKTVKAYTSLIRERITEGWHPDSAGCFLEAPMETMKEE